MLEWLTDLQLRNGFWIKPLIVGSLVSIVCSVIGCFIVLRRMAFLADAIAHSMLAGVIAGYLIMKICFGAEADLGAMLVGALLAGILTVALIGLVTRVSRIKQDTAIGIMYTGIFALGAFVISTSYFGRMIQIDIYHFIVGSVLAVSDAELWLLGIVTSLVLSVVVLFYRPLQLTSFDPIMAASIGVPVLAIEYLLTACTSLVVVSGVRVAGVVLVVALLITPAATAYLLFNRLPPMMVGAALIGLSSYWLGFWLASAVGAAPGSSVVVVSTLIFLGTLVLSPRRGLIVDWLHRPQWLADQVAEDILGLILRHPREWVSVPEVLRASTNRDGSARQGLQSLLRRGLLEQRGSEVKLTDEGRRAATQLVRAHRLWETYLQRAGLPEPEWHRTAHVLEHVTDDRTVDYLDDKLGHPLADPHGSEIPADIVHLDQNVDVRVSMLRAGDRAEVRSIGAEQTGLELSVGQRIAVGPRVDGGQTWTLSVEGGPTLRVDHCQADSILVRVLSAESAEPGEPSVPVR
jgi:manganese/iron transport system permease protein/iron/zinc/copper transport system permease protein